SYPATHRPRLVPRWSPPPPPTTDGPPAVKPHSSAAGEKLIARANLPGADQRSRPFGAGTVLVLRVLGQMKARFHPLKVIFADRAYGRNNLPECVKDAFGWLLQTGLRPAEVKGFVVLPKRWTVERTFGWLGRYRRHSKDYERNTASSEAMIDIAMT